MSATAQPWALRLSRRMTVFSCVLSFFPLSPLCTSSPSHSFHLSQFIFILSPLLFFSPLSPFSFICVTVHINLFLLHKCVCPHFYSYFQMPLHAKRSIKAEHGHSSDIRQGFQHFGTFWGNIVIFENINSEAPINSQIFDPCLWTAKRSLFSCPLSGKHNQNVDYSCKILRTLECH